MGFFRKTTGIQHDRPDTSPFVSSTTTTPLSSPPKWRRGFRVTGVTFLIMTTAAAVVIADSQVTSQSGPPKSNPTKGMSSHTVQLHMMPTNPPPPLTTKSDPSTTVHATTNSTGDSATQLTVNGQSVPVPQNGSVDRSFTNDTGTTSVNVSTSTDGSTSNTSSTSLDLNVTTSDSSGGNTHVHMNSQGSAY